MLGNMFKNLRVEMDRFFTSMDKTFEAMDKDFQDINRLFDEASENGRVEYKRETRPDGSVVVTKTTVVPAPPKKEEPKAERVRTLEDELWKNVYFRLKGFWDEAIVISFDGKYYTVGFLRSGVFQQRGCGDSIEMAVKDVEGKFDRTK